MIRFDDKSPAQRIEEAVGPSDPLKMAWGTFAASTTLVCGTAMVAMNPALILGGATVGGVLKAFASVPLIIKLATGASFAMYLSQYQTAPKMVEVTEVSPISGSWRIPVGVTKTGKVLYFDFNRIPHLGVSGKTGTGKTVAMQALLWYICHQHGPEDVEILICDFKGACSFAHMERLPHIKGNIYQIDQAIEILEESLEEQKRRLEIIRKARYNLQTPPRFKRRIILFDEGAELAPANAVTKEEREQRQKAMSILSSLVRIGREPMINVIYGTQRPSHETLPVQIRGQMDAFMAFRQEGNDSAISLGNDDKSASLLPGVKGRMIYKTMDGRDEIQGIYVPENLMYDWLRSYIPDDELVIDNEDQSISAADSIKQDQSSTNKPDKQVGLPSTLSTPSISNIWE